MLRLTIFLVVVTSTYSKLATADDYCSLPALKGHAKTACGKLYDRYARNIAADWSREGYLVEKVPETRNRRQTIISSNLDYDPKAFSKKITHPDFPIGGYILVHHPNSKYIHSSRNFPALQKHNRHNPHQHHHHHHSFSSESTKNTHSSKNDHNSSDNEINSSYRHHKNHKNHKNRRDHHEDHLRNEVLTQDMISSSSHSSENFKNMHDMRFKRDDKFGVDYCCSMDCEILMCSDDFDIV